MKTPHPALVLLGATVAIASPVFLATLANSSSAAGSDVVVKHIIADVASVSVNANSETVQILAAPSVAPASGSYITDLELNGAPTIPPTPTNPTTITTAFAQTINVESIELSFSAQPAESYPLTYTSPSSSTTSAPQTPRSTSFSTSSTSTSRFNSTTTSPTISSSASSSLASPSSSSITSSLTTPTSASVSLSSSNTASPTPSPTGGSDIFSQPIDTSAPLSIFTRQPKHPLQPLSINANDLSLPIETNKFYANLFLGTQANMMWTHPYGIWWDQANHGFGVSQVDRSQLAFGPQNTLAPSGTDSSFNNPILIKSVGFSAAEFDSSTALSLDTLEMFSINANLVNSDGSMITLPTVQGQAFVTAIYKSLTPIIQTNVFWKTVTTSTPPRSGVVKYKLDLEDGNSWLIYGVAASGSAALELKVSANDALTGSSPFSGIIQIAKIPQNNLNAESIYDSHAGTYATTATLSGTASGSVGSYSITYNTAGSSPDGLLMFALPHHQASWTSSTSQNAVDIELTATTKGMMKAYSSSTLSLEEDSMPTEVSWLPWIVSGNVSTYSKAALQSIATAANGELQQDMSQQSDSNSMYYAGKTLAKFAYICLAINDIVQDQSVASQCVQSLEAAYSRFTDNQQIFPLNYDETYKGLLSSASYTTGDSGADFGNTYYNDHHFHYGYFISAAAIISHIDPTWLPKNKDYVNTMVRDVANPSKLDTFFPVSRSFDWFHGHSWAKGLFESGDGKDEESSSEDVNHAFAIKLWGQVNGDSAMEARGNLMCAILRRSLNSYFMMSSTNTIQPAEFINNRASGILFENKVDHTTYFGTLIEYIEGIHMLPLIPISAYTRLQQFVTEEWNEYFATYVNSVAGGWRGILYANLALIDPVTSYQWFTQPNFDSTFLDGGASLTWYIAFAAGLGGA